MNLQFFSIPLYCIKIVAKIIVVLDFLDSTYCCPYITEVCLSKLWHEMVISEMQPDGMHHGLGLFQVFVVREVIFLTHDPNLVHSAMMATFIFKFWSTLLGRDQFHLGKFYPSLGSWKRWTGEGKKKVVSKGLCSKDLSKSI